MSKEKYTDYEMCKKCKGACCKQNGCVYKTTDFQDMDFYYLKEKLEKGRISISGQAAPIAKNAWTYIPFLRARNKNAGIVDLITDGGPCINLTNNGCILTEDERPSYGLSVKPTKIGGPCDKINSDDAINWLDYSNVLEKLIKYYTNEEMIDIIVDEISKQMHNIIKKCKEHIPLNPMEKTNADWYYNIMANKAYYAPEEVKKMMLF